MYVPYAAGAVTVHADYHGPDRPQTVSMVDVGGVEVPWPRMRPDAPHGPEVPMASPHFLARAIDAAWNVAGGDPREGRRLAVAVAAALGVLIADERDLAAAARRVRTVLDALAGDAERGPWDYLRGGACE